MKLYLIIFGICLTHLAFAQENTCQTPGPSARQGLIARGGLIIHGNCLNMLESTPLGVLREANIDSFLEKVEYSYQLIGQCEEQYSELSLYTDEWRRQFHQQFMFCVPNNTYPSAAGWFCGKHFFLPQSQLYELEQVPFNESSKKKKLNTLVHELFHGTSANNRVDHNTVERISPYNSSLSAPSSENSPTPVDVKCDDHNSAIDRVSVVTSLCTGAKLNSTDKQASEVIYDRINKCGLQRGCRGIFNGLHNNYPELKSLTQYLRTLGQYLPSRNLSFRESRTLCEKIYIQGRCVKLKRQSFWQIRQEKARSHPALVRRIRSRLMRIMPTSSGHIPKMFIESSQKLVEMAQDLEDNRCMKQLFRKNRSGWHFKKNVQRYGRPLAVDFKQHFHLLNELVLSDSDYANCNQDQKHSIRSFLSQLNLNLMKWQRGLAVFNLLRNFALERVNHEHGFTAELDNIEVFLNLPEQTQEILTNIVGDNNFQAYLTQVREVHQQVEQVPCP